MEERTPNRLSSISQLNHEYFALRHGQSLANLEHIISSDPGISTVQHGLSELGREQVLASAQKFCSQIMEGNDRQPISIISSDFRRAKETAQIFAQVLMDEIDDLRLILLNQMSEEQNINFDKRLRERYFGDLNGQPDHLYKDVWKQDEINSAHTFHNVESVDSVMERTTGLIIDLDEQLSQALQKNHDSDKRPKQSTCKCILVAHGDVLQILQTAFLKCSGREHRSLPHLDTGSIRKLNIL